jgi:hypothetical protein
MATISAWFYPVLSPLSFSCAIVRARTFPSFDLLNQWLSLNRWVVISARLISFPSMLVLTILSLLMLIPRNVRMALGHHDPRAYPLARDPRARAPGCSAFLVFDVGTHD